MKPTKEDVEAFINLAQAGGTTFASRSLEPASGAGECATWCANVLRSAVQAEGLLLVLDENGNISPANTTGSGRMIRYSR